MTSSDELLNQQIGEYRIVERIGGGGMSEGVYRAKHVKLENDVAVKVMDIGAGMTEDRRRRVLEEPRRTARLNHPNIIKVYDVIDQGSRLYMVMDYVSGGDLLHRIEEHRAHELSKQGNVTGSAFIPTPMPDQFVASVIRQVGRALDYAHNQGLIHRDIKPHNILLSDEDHVVITDFGIAKALSATELSITREGVGVGTPPYMSPEQLKGDDLSPASDVYSLGIVAYRMLTGKVPFEGDSSLVIAHKHLNDPPPPPRQLNPKLSKQVESVLLKALAKKPSDRYDRAGTFASQLVEALVGSTASLDLPTLTFQQRLLESRAWGVVGGFGRFAGRAVTAFVTALINSIVYILIGVALFAALLAGGGAYLGARFVENVVANNDWKFNEMAAEGAKAFTLKEMEANLNSSAQLYFPGSVESPTLFLKPPDGIRITATVLGQWINLDGTVDLASGYPVVKFQTLNGRGLSVFGSLFAGGVNRGFARALDTANAKITQLTMTGDSITVGVEAGSVVVSQVPQQVLAEGVLLQDDFSDLNSGWPRSYSYEAAHLSYEDGRYRIDVRQPNLLVLQDIAAQLGEFDVSVDVQLGSGPQSLAYGLALLEKDQSNYAALMLTGDGFRGLEVVSDGNSRMLLEWKPVEGFLGQAKPDTLRARVNAGTIVVYINGKEAGSVNIPGALKDGGRIGFIVRTAGEGNATVYFDNLTAKKP